MSINRSQSQLLFETIFTLGSNPPFKQIPKSAYETTALSQQQAQDLHNCLSHEVMELYYKALLSFAEAYSRIVYNSYSWPTIELYYSVFYATKAFLYAYDYAILRAERRLYFVCALPNQRFVKCNNTTDHKATFEVLANSLYNFRLYTFEYFLQLQV